MTGAVRVRLLAAFVAGSVGPIIFLSSVVRAEEVCAPTDTDCTLETMPSPATGSTEDVPGHLLEPIVTIVGDVLGEAPIVDPPGGGGAGHVPGSDSGSSGSATGGPGDAGPTVTIREPVVPAAPTIISAASGSRPLPPHGSRGRSAPIIEETVKSLLVLLLLVGFAVGFVLLQDRVDRNDPKLGTPPARADDITFV